MKRVLLFLLCLIVFFICYCIKTNKKIIGYKVQEMIRAKDSSRYYDTIATIYFENNKYYIKEKPYCDYP